MRTSLLLVSGVLLAGCSSSSNDAVAPPVDASTSDAPGLVLDDATSKPVHDAGRDVGHDAASDVAAPAGYPAAHPPQPQVVNAGGPVMLAPKFVIVTFAGDSLAPSIDDFADKVAASATYWSGTTAEYGVGKVAAVTHLTIDEAPTGTMTDADVQAWITAKLAAPDAGALDGGAPWPQPDGETIYMVFYPTGVTVTMNGGTSCDDYYGYHDNYARAGGPDVTYSVVTRCPAFPMTSVIDSIAAIASHELVEAATDPFPSTKPAWSAPDAAHTAWALPAGGELGDMCAGFGNVFYEPVDVPYLVQRTWSNQAALAGHDPCQPDGASPYFNAALVLPDSVTIADPTLGTFTTKGAKIALNGTKTLEVDLYSDAPTPGPWTIQAYDLSSIFGGTQQLELTFANGQSSTTGTNGEKLELTVTVVQEGTGGGEYIWLQSMYSDTMPVWIGAVGNN